MTLMDGVFGKDSQAPAILRDGGRARSLPLTRVLVVLLLVGVSLCISGPRRRHSPGLPATTRRCASRLRISTRPNSPRCRSRGSTLSMRRRAPWVRRSSSTPTSPAVGPSRVRLATALSTGSPLPIRCHQGATGCAAGAGRQHVQCGLSGALFLGWTCNRWSSKRCCRW